MYVQSDWFHDCIILVLWLVSCISRVNYVAYQAHFDIENDFTPEEEEEVRRENAWAEDI